MFIQHKLALRLIQPQTDGAKIPSPAAAARHRRPSNAARWHLPSCPSWSVASVASVGACSCSALDCRKSIWKKKCTNILVTYLISGLLQVVDLFSIDSIAKSFLKSASSCRSCRLREVAWAPCSGPTCGRSHALAIWTHVFPS